LAPHLPPDRLRDRRVRLAVDGHSHLEPLDVDPALGVDVAVAHGVPAAGAAVEGGVPAAAPEPAAGGVLDHPGMPPRGAGGLAPVPQFEGEPEVPIPRKLAGLA